MIPYGRLSTRSVQRLMEFLITELRRVQSERAPLEERWLRWLRAYDADSDKTKKDFPFMNASNVTVSMVATDVDTMWSGLMAQLFATDSVWTCEPTRPDFVDFAPRLREFLRWAQKEELDMYNPVADWVLELCKLGTGVLKQRYVRETRKVYEFRESEQGTYEQERMILFRDHPEVRRTALWNFFIPPDCPVITEAPWVAEKVRPTMSDIVRRVREGIYDPAFVQRMQASSPERGHPIDRYMQEREGFQPSIGLRHGLYEFWLDWDIDDDGEEEAVVCTIHPESYSYARLDFNPFIGQEPPFSVARYMRREGWFYGIGLCEMGDQYQIATSTMVNQRIDAGTVANAPMMKGLKTAGFKEDEPIYIGRMWLVENMADLEAMNYGRPPQSTIPDELQLRAYHEQRTGVNDYMRARPEPAVGYAAATTTIEMLRQGAKRPDQVLREVRHALNETGVRVVEMYQQFNQHGKEFFALGEEDGALVHQILQFPLDLIRRGVRIDTTATSAQANEELTVRKNMMLMQVLTGFYTQLFQAVQIMLNPAVPLPLRNLAAQMANGGTILMRRVLDAQGIQDIDALVPQVAEALQSGIQTLLTINQSLGSGAPGGAGPPANGGMGAVPGGVGGTPPNIMGGPAQGGGPSLALPGPGQAGFARNGAGPAQPFTPPI